MFKQLLNMFKGEKADDNLRTVPNYFKTIECPANDPSEDRISYGYIEEIEAHYLAVFDGHGGSKVSEYLQNNVRSTIIQVIKNRSKVTRDNETLIKISLPYIFECLEQNILQIMNKEAIQKSSNFESCGSCALLAIVTKTNIHVANSGDSQGLVLNTDSQKNKVTNDQHNTKQPSEIKRLRNKFLDDDNILQTVNGVPYVKGKLMTTHSLGDFSLKYKSPSSSMVKQLKIPFIQYKPEIRNYEIRNDDKFLLLASDGLWDLLSPSEVAQIMASTSQSNFLQVLVERCYDKCAINSNTRKQEIERLKNKRVFIDDISIILFDLSIKI